LNVRTPPQLFIIAISISGVVFGAFALLLLRKILESPETASARIKLEPDKTATDFKILMISNALIAVFMAIYGLGGFFEAEMALSSVEWSLVVLSAPPVAVFLRLWRRM
jgi:hypothetical protein